MVKKADSQQLAIQSFVDEMIKQGQFSYNPDVESLDHCRKRYSSAIEKNISNYQSRVNDGMKIIVDSHIVSDSVIDDVKGKIAQLDLNDESTMKQMTEGAQIYEIVDLPIPFLEACYELATKKMEAGEWERAISVLLFLATVGPYVSQHWHGLGICTHFQNEQESALLNFAFAFDLSTDSQNQFISLIWIIKTLEAMGKTEQAKGCKEIGEKMIQEDHTLEEMRSFLGK